MTRDEMIARMSSQELTGWFALFTVQAEEAKHAAEVAKHGEVIYHGRDEDDDETEDGETE